MDLTDYRRCKEPREASHVAEEAEATSQQAVPLDPAEALPCSRAPCARGPVAKDGLLLCRASTRVKVVNTGASIWHRKQPATKPFPTPTYENADEGGCEESEDPERCACFLGRHAPKSSCLNIYSNKADSKVATSFWLALYDEFRLKSKQNK